MSIQFLLIYDREEFQMGSFVIGKDLILFARPCVVYVEINESKLSQLLKIIAF